MQMENFHCAIRRKFAKLIRKQSAGQKLSKARKTNTRSVKCIDKNRWGRRAEGGVFWLQIAFNLWLFDLRQS